MAELSSAAPGRRRLQDLDPLDMAEALLLTLDRGQLTAIDVTPSPGGHRVRGERSGHAVVLAELPPALGDALVARLTLLAGLDLVVETEQLGRLRTRQPERPVSVDHLVASRRTPAGRALDVRVLVSDASPPVRGAAAASRSLGTYRLGEEIGRGGMGVVYRGEHLTLQKPVAIKVLHHGFVRDADAATRLIMEARAACRARHPAIVDVSDVGRLPDGRTFLVMELLDGPTLQALLEEGPLPVRRALGIAEQVAGALQVASEAGVVHRDVKPGNLFVLQGDRVKIADFGVARILAGDGDGEATDSVAGTAWYMSPEQASGQAVDVRSDLYALGVILFEMLTGRVPFDAEVPAEVMAAHASRPVSSVVAPEGRVASAVEAVVRRALEKDREARFGTPAEMAEALRQAAGALDDGGPG